MVQFKAQTQFLLIENDTEAPTEAYTKLGFSTARGNDNLIGKFGTGNKLAITLLLRKGLKVFVFCGLTKIEFGVRCEDIKGHKCRNVTYKIGNRKPRDTGWTLDWGSIDWTHITMALREFVANSIDQHVDHGLDLPSVMQVNDDQRRAKAGVTRVYVEINDSVRKYFANLGDNFLHFSDHPERVLPGLLPKSTPGPARIYRMGALVCEMDQSEGNSLFDYNFSNSQMEIDECRNSNPYTTRAACAKRLRSAGKEALTLLFKSWQALENTFESRLDVDYILNEWAIPDPAHVAEWVGAWHVATQGAVVVPGDATKEMVEKRGKGAVIIRDQSRARLMKRMGIPSADDVLSESELQGRTELPATPYALAAVDIAWSIVEAHTEKKKPGVLCFSETINPDDPQLGFQDAVGVHLRNDICQEPSAMLDKEALRYVLQWVSGSYELRQELILELLLEAVAV